MQAQVRNFSTIENVLYSPQPKHWAIIIGISKYRHKPWKLNYAASDAKALSKLIQTASGGGFEKECICELFDKDATMANVLRALRSFLKKPAAEDLVLIYFACHGGPDPERPQNLYLLTYDTDPREIGATALRMSEIEQALDDTLLAKKVVIIADTCHSAAIGDSRRGNDNVAAVTNRYLDEIRKARSGRALLTSAQASEVALEDKRWGDGHGVFTYFLLQGMQGAADGYSQPKDGKVSVGELFDYVRDRVQKATDNLQHPAIGLSDYDRNLVMAITGGIDAQDHQQLGCQLYELGWLLNDAGRFAAAGRQFEEAIRWSRVDGVPFPEAELGLGKSMLALGDYERAAQVLQNLVDQTEKNGLAEAWLYAGMAHARRSDLQNALAAFEQLIEHHHPQHELTAWIGEYAALLRAQQISKKYAILIGINHYASSDLPQLRGSLNDVVAMQQLLTQQYGFTGDDIITLTDDKATHQAIIKALQSLAAKARPEDSVVVHYSGVGVNGDKSAEGSYLIPYDVVHAQEVFQNNIEASEMDALMHAIPARRKALLLDTNANARFIEQARQQTNYVLLVATSLGEEAYEYVPGYKRDDRLSLEVAATSRGLFSFVVGEQLVAIKPHMFTLSGLEKAIHQQYQALGYENQTPLIIGDEDRFPFVEDQFYPDIFAFAQRRNFSAFSLEALLKNYARFLTRVNAPFAQAYYSFGCAFLEKGINQQAKEALQIALDQSDGQAPAVILALFKQQIKVGELDEAFVDLQNRVQRLQDSKWGSQLQTLVAMPSTLHKHALLIGINDYTAANAPSLRGAVNDAKAFRQLLLTKFGFQAEHITLLIDKDATRAAILGAFQQLIEQARTEPAFFFFAGYGALDEQNAPILVSADGHQGSILGIRLHELAQYAQSGATNLVTMIDVGYLRRNEKYVDGDRSMPVVKQPATRAIRIPIPDGQLEPVGATAIYSWLIGARLHSRSSSVKLDRFLERDSGQLVHGGLTAMLLQSFNGEVISSWTYAQWITDCEKRYGSAPLILGDNTQTMLVNTKPLQNKILKTMTELEQRPAYQIIDLLPRLLEKRYNRYPEGYLNLGIAYGVIGNATKAIAALEEALDPNEVELAMEARYHLGRVLFEYKQQLGRAVNELEIVTRPSNRVRGESSDDYYIRAHYYHGQAIRAIVERETLVEAEKMLRIYLERGAPLGDQTQVLAFLMERDPAAQKQAALQAGLAFVEQNAFEESIPLFEKAIALGASEAHFHLGRALFMLKNYTDAVSAMQNAINHDANNGEAHYYLAEALRMLEEQKILEKAFVTYLQSEAQIGDRNNVRALLVARNYLEPSTR